MGSPTPTAAVDPARAELTISPKPPRLQPVPTDYATPQAVAGAWLAVNCYQPISQPANWNLAAEAPWVTATSWDFDKATAVSAQQWALTVHGGLTQICGPVVAAVSAEAPSGPRERWVQVSARRAYVNAAGRIIGQQTTAQTRRVLRDTTGRWLVDVGVNAG